MRTIKALPKASIQFFLIAVSLSLLLTSCATTKLNDSWQSDDFSRGQLDKVLVVAVTSNKSTRLLYETAFVDELKRHNIEATASINKIGAEFPKREAVEALLAKEEYKYVLVTKLGSIDVEKDYVPPKAITYYTGPYYRSYGDYWYDNGNTVTLTQEGYTDTRRDINLVTSIYALPSEELVWVGRSNTFDATSATTVGEELAAKMTSNITR